MPDSDHVDTVLAQWSAAQPDLDVRTMGVLGRLARLERVAAAAQSRTFARHGIDPASFDVLATLRRADVEALTPAALARSSMITTGAVTQRLDRLERAGWVTRQPHGTDGRSVEVALTTSGRAVVDAVLPDHLNTQDHVLEALDQTDRDHLAGLLRRLLHAHDA